MTAGDGAGVDDAGVARMAARMAERLASEGHPWPDQAAALLAERGRRGLDRAAYAAAAGVPLHEVVAIEEGWRRPDR